jgi:hypothetical protein
MITTITFILFFGMVSLMDKLLFVVPQILPGITYLNSFLASADSLVYLVRSVMPLTISMIFGFVAGYFGIMFLLVFIKMFFRAVPILGNFRISLGYGGSSPRFGGFMSYVKNRKSGRIYGIRRDGSRKRMT